MKKIRIVVSLALFLLSLSNECVAQLVVNEIMYAPASGKPEWIELYNPTSSPIDIRGWILYDATSARPIITTNPTIIPADGYLVIAKDASILNDFPELTSKLVVMEKLPTLNNTGDDITLARTDTSVVETISYRSSWGGQGGKSLERIDALLPGNTPLNWTTSIAAEGATPGKRNSASPTELDLAISGIQLQPPFPRRGDAVILAILVRNVGTKDANGFTAALYEDLNDDGQPDPSEQIFTSSGGLLGPGMTTQLSGMFPASSSNQRVVIVTLEFNGDENPSNNTRVDTIHYGLPRYSVVLNEIMYAPTSGEPEWVEVYNTTSEEVDLAGWKIGDNATVKELSGATTRIQPGGYLVITSSASILDYHAIIPAPLITVSIPSLNNTGDDARILDRAGFLMDSIRYTADWGGAEGRSLERIHYGFPSQDRTNWSTSTDGERSTPGRRNSVALRNHDLAISQMSQSGSDISITVRNMGLETSTGGELRLYLDSDTDSIPSPQELMGSVSIPSLRLFDSTRYSFAGVIQLTGQSQFIGFIEYAPDEQRFNNTRVISVHGAFPKGSLTINEIMYAPLSGEAEWVEYVNTGSSALNVQGFKLTDQPASDGRRTLLPLPSSSPLIVPSQGYLVVASDTSIFTRYRYLTIADPSRLVVVLHRSSLNLNNTTDEVVLLDPLGRMIDSIRFDDKWHNPNVTATTGRSLERLNPEFSLHQPWNWSTSAAPEGGTPGLRNTLFTTRPPDAPGNQISLTFAPNPFSPDNDGFEDYCVISYSLPAAVSQMRLRVFDTQGRLVRTVANNVPSGTRGQIIWDGLDDDKQRLRVGMYVVLLEALDIHNNITASKKGVVVVATRL